jgi:hypothetical protein
MLRIRGFKQEWKQAEALVKRAEGVEEQRQLAYVLARECVVRTWFTVLLLLTTASAAAAATAAAAAAAAAASVCCCCCCCCCCC